MKNKKTRVALLAIDLFVALTALIGALWVVPSLPLSLLKFFPDYTVPALGLGAVSILSLVAAVAVGVRPEVGAELSVIAGAAMAFFEVVEAMAVGNLVAPPPGTTGGSLWLQPVYFVLGVIMVVLGVRVWSRTSPQQGGSVRLRHPLTLGLRTAGPPPLAATEHRPQPDK